MPKASEKISFVTARASQSNECAMLIYSSGMEMFEFSFGKFAETAPALTSPSVALDFITFAFSHGYGFASYRLHTVAVVGGEVAGIGAIYRKNQLWSLTAQEFFAISRFFGIRRLMPIWRRCNKVGEVISQQRHNEAYLANFAVSPKFRRQGIGRALARNLIAQAQDRSALLIDVVVDNTPAYRLYKSLGFQSCGKRLEAKTSGIPDTQPMRLDF
ncbi:MAG: GNAT family N-acetyltransferase [Deltaproteobacteria bacterium]|nr:GNAT family N-acetyltransferase [Deltaproteobacteria bacterium]